MPCSGTIGGGPRFPFPQPEHATSATILTLHLGKFNSVFCRFDPATKATTFRTVPTNPEAIREALQRQSGPRLSLNRDNSRISLSALSPTPYKTP